MCDIPIAGKPADKGLAAVGADFINLATVARSGGTSELYSGRGLLAQEYYLAKQISRCNPCGWLPGKGKKAVSKRGRRLDGKRIQRRRHFLHAVTRRIVDTCVEKGLEPLSWAI